MITIINITNINITTFRKIGFVCRHTIAQKDFERTCADYCISGEKGLCQRGAFTAFQMIFIFCCSSERKAVYDRPIRHVWPDR